MSILLTRADDCKTDQQLLDGMFRLRHHVFRERLNWDVESRNGMEKDRFDELNPVYVMSRPKGKDVNGCWRLLPTTGPYMLKEIFPELLRGEPAPSDPAIWEISRFTILSNGRGDLAQGTMSPLTFQMMQRVFDFAVENGIRSYVAVTSVAVERLFRFAGIPVRRFGDGKAQWIGKVRSVACWFDINEHSHRAVYRLAAPRKREAA